MKNIGTNISVNLLEKETKFKEFSQFYIEEGHITYEDLSSGHKIDRELEFGITLTTNKVPATISVPVAKFFTDPSMYSDYYDGRLRFRLYYSEELNTIGAWH